MSAYCPIFHVSMILLHVPSDGSSGCSVCAAFLELGTLKVAILRSHAWGGWSVCRSPFSFIRMVIHVCFFVVIADSFGHDALAIVSFHTFYSCIRKIQLNFKLTDVYFKKIINTNPLPYNMPALKNYAKQHKLSSYEQYIVVRAIQNGVNIR